MKEEILEVLWDIINDGKQPDIAYKELCVLFDVSQQSEPFINFAKEVIEYYEQHDIGAVSYTHLTLPTIYSV